MHLAAATCEVDHVRGLIRPRSEIRVDSPRFRKPVGSDGCPAAVANGRCADLAVSLFGDPSQGGLIYDGAPRRRFSGRYVFFVARFLD
jgi:hypothetical protein